MAVEYKISTDAPRTIIIEGEGSLTPFVEFMDGEIIDTFDGEIVEIPFTEENASKLRHFLRGKEFEIPAREKAVLAYLADHPGCLEDKDLRWSLKLTDLKANKLTNIKGMRSIKTEWDLIHYLPLRYLDKSNPQTIDELTVGGWAVVAGTVVGVETNYEKNFVKVIIKDIKGNRISAAFFRQMWLAKIYREEDPVVVYGNYSEYVNQKTQRRYPQITNAKIDKIKPGQMDLAQGLGMLPIYPQKSENKSWALKNAQEELLNKTVWIEDPVPARILNKYNLVSRTEAYKKIHFPDNRNDVEEARRRIAFDEYIRLQVYVQRLKEQNGTLPSGSKKLLNWSQNFRNSLPFDFTGAQERVISEIGKDLASNEPMYRLLQGDVGSGKAQPLYSKVLTPNGFTTMGEILPGDEVLTPNGKIEKVVSIFPQGKRPVYELTFRDNSKVRADINHLWEVTQGLSRTNSGRIRNPRVVNTQFLIDNLKRKGGKTAGVAQWFINYPDNVSNFGGTWESSIAPYTLGAILGDGNITSDNGVRFHASEHSTKIVEQMKKETETLSISLRLAESRINPKTNVATNTYWLIKNRSVNSIEQHSNEISLENIKNLIQTGFKITEIRKHLNISSNKLKTIAKEGNIVLQDLTVLRDQNPLVKELTRLGLQGKDSWAKFIPQELLNSDKESRLRLLQGLLDTDGYSPKATYKTLSFTSVSKELADNVAYLVRSLSGKASVLKKQRKSGLSWEVVGWLPDEYAPFTLENKLERYNSQISRPLQQAKAIVNIEYVGEEETKCILITGEEHLYITDDFTITHNTEISSVAALTVAESGYQVALLAPTDILANQLYERLEKTFRKAGISDKDLRIELFTGKILGKRRKLLLEELKEGKINVIVGTHALVSKGVEFENLGLAVIDEMHKFGSEQRTNLRKTNTDGTVPDLLMMSATPIPRTVSQVMYGNLDVSIVDELPAERIPIVTEWHETPDLAWVKIREEVEKGHQAYVVASLVEDSDKIENVESAVATYQELQYSVFPDFKIGLLHGKLSKEEKEEVIGKFYDGTIQVLVATSVVEVGVNVPNSTVMTILNANRFGIASLHQIRGRVGRGALESYCYLIGQATVPEAEERLNALVASNDGFWLAEKDLEIRGEGTLFSTIQSGDSDLYVGNLKEHKDLLEVAKKVAKQASSSVLLNAEINMLYANKTILA